jgi:beta-exotoxin I transport system permease protein
MLGSVGLKAVRDLRRGFVYWSLGLAGMVALMVSVYPSVRNDPSLNHLVQSYPDALKNLIGFGGRIDYVTPAGYLGSELFSFMVPLLLIVAAVAAGSGAVAGEEERGTLDLLLSLPIGRGRIVAEKLAAIVAEIAGLGAVLWVSMWIGAQAVDMRISGAHLGAATISAILIALVFGAIALLVGAATGRRGLSIAGPACLAVAGYLVNALAPLASSLAGAQDASPFYYYASSDPLRSGLDPADVARLAALAVASGLLAIPAFRRRDLTS